MKKLILFVLTIIFSLTLFSCSNESTNTVTLPSLDGLSRAEIAPILEKAGINYLFKFSDKIVYSEDALDKFINYNGTLQAGDRIEKNYQVYVYTTVLPFTFNNTSEAVLDFDYEGKSYINDGIGKVTLVSATDGDTARFYDPITKEEFRLRFLGIDTPESTIDKDPWGKAASNYTKNKLTNAKEIVLESMDRTQATKETYGRYLGFVWVDGVLLNLELINLAYTNSTLSEGRYEELFAKASAEAKKTGRRFFGETDPNYDYQKKQFK